MNSENGEPLSGSPDQPPDAGPGPGHPPGAGPGQPPEDRSGEPQGSGPAPEPSLAGRIAALFIIGPVLILAGRAGCQIAAEREADRIGRRLAGITEDGRPDPNALLRVQRGSWALIDEVIRLMREGPYEQRTGLARALGFSRRVEALRPLVLAFRDGCISPDALEEARDGWPGPAYPPDALALSLEAKGRAAVIELEKDGDPYVATWAHLHLLACRARPVDRDVVRAIAGRDALFRGRAVAGALAVVDAGGPVALDAVPGLVALLGPSPIGRVAARLLASGAVPEEKKPEVQRLAAELTPADRALAADDRATAREARALVRGEAAAASRLAALAARDPAARAALVAAVGSATDVRVRAAAGTALAGLGN